MFKLIRAERCFTPAAGAAREILVAGNQILAVGKDLEIHIPAGMDCEILDGGPGSVAVPGFVDNHVHIIGGGGEGGYHTRVPEIQLTEITAAGVTTVIGVLGTDDISRHLESLLAKARGLEYEGITAFILTGSYSLPVLSLTGSVKRDMVLIDKIVGVGEVAVSDHRASKAPFQALKDAAAGCRLGGLLSGKGGVLQVHLGSDPEGFAPLKRLIAERIIPRHQILPTHVNRTRELFEEAAQYTAAGGNIDLTAFDFPHGGALTAAEAIGELKQRQISLQRVTLSSDSNGSIPEVDDEGRMIGLRRAAIKTLLLELGTLLDGGRISWEELLPVVTSNPAALFGLKNKGRLSPGCDADIAVFDTDPLRVCHLLARGRVMVAHGKPVVVGTFEG